MSTMAASFIRADDWNADVYGSVSAAFRTSGVLRQGRNLVKAWFGFNHLNGLLEAFFGAFDEVVTDAQGKTVTNDRAGMTSDEWDRAIDLLWNMHSALDHLYQLSVRKGLRKKPLLTKQLARLEVGKERTLDLIQWIQYSTNDTDLEAANEMFSAGLEEFQRGETVTVG